MGAIERGSLPADLERARSRFRAWRSCRKIGTRIPRTLWALAVRLAKAHGVCRTAAALGGEVAEDSVLRSHRERSANSAP